MIGYLFKAVTYNRNGLPHDYGKNLDVDCTTRKYSAPLQPRLHAISLSLLVVTFSAGSASLVDEVQLVRGNSC